MRNVIGWTRITPDDANEFSNEYVIETDQGFYWLGCGERSIECFPSFLAAVRFALQQRQREADITAEAEAIVCEVEAQLKGQASMSPSDLAEWIDEYRQKCHAGIPGWCEITPGEFGPTLFKELAAEREARGAPVLAIA